MKTKLPLFIRRFDATDLFEIFLVSSVLSIITIRVFLAATGYPQVGGDTLHIAHMLWGGFLMLGAIMLLLFFSNRPIVYLAAFVGGLGFGTFIDELGKFITTDNDYFFKPTFALIYIIFILLFFAFQFMIRKNPASQAEYLANALDILKDAVAKDFDVEKRKLYKSYLKSAKLATSTTKQLISIADQFEINKDYRPNIFSRLISFVTNKYTIVTKTNLFSKIVTLVFILKGLSILITTSFFVTGLVFLRGELIQYGNMNAFSNLISNFGFFDWGAIISSIVVNILILIGLFRLRNSYISSLNWFRRSLLVSIFFVQFFAFYHDQLTAVVGVFVDIFLLFSIDFMISKAEREVPNP